MQAAGTTSPSPGEGLAKRRLVLSAWKLQTDVQNAEIDGA